MTLKDFRIARETVAFKGGSLELRGLALDDITELMRGHLGEINQLFDMYDKSEQRETALAESANFAVKIVKECPEMVALGIALAADEPDAIAVARKLPLPVQVECVRKIFEITFEESGGAKKFIDSLLSLVRGMRPSSKED